jgi:hypothetical protein
LSDGTVTKHPPNSKFQIGSINKEFLDWLSGLLGVFSGEVKLSEDAESVAERNRKSGFSPNATADSHNDYYRLRSMAHPVLNDMRDKWYDDGKKSIPDGFELSPRKLKMWYIGDGSLNHKQEDRSNRATISNMGFDDERCFELLKRKGIESHSSDSNSHIRLSVDGTNRLFDYIGSEVPGFEYKWPDR